MDYIANVIGSNIPLFHWCGLIKGENLLWIMTKNTSVAKHTSSYNDVSVWASRLENDMLMFLLISVVYMPIVICLVWITCSALWLLCSLLWLCICLHDVSSKFCTEASYAGSPFFSLLYWINTFCKNSFWFCVDGKWLFLSHSLYFNQIHCVETFAVI